MPFAYATIFIDGFIYERALVHESLSQALGPFPWKRTVSVESYSLRSNKSDDPSTRSTCTSMTTRRGLGRGVR